MAEDVVILKKINKLDQLKVQPNLYRTNTLNPDEVGELDGQYKGNTLLGSKRNVTPIWDTLKEKWAFEGTIQDLKRLQNILKFRGRDGKVIEIDEDVFHNMEHPFWASKDLWTKKIMEDGSVPLVMNNALDELLYRVQQGNSFTKKNDEVQSSYVLADSNMELISPKRTVKLEADKVNDAMEALRLLDGMSLDKMNAVAFLLDLPGYSTSDKDSESLKALLYSSAVSNTSPISRFGSDITYQKKFIELAKTKNDELNIMQKVQRAKLLGIISSNSRTGYTFKGEKIDGGNVRNDKQLMVYFLNPKNYDMLVEVEILLKDAEDIANKK